MGKYHYIRRKVTWNGKRYEVRGKTEAEALEKLTACLYELSSFRDSMYYGKQLVSALEQIISFSESDRFLKYLEC